MKEEFFEYKIKIDAWNWMKEGFSKYKTKMFQ